MIIIIMAEKSFGVRSIQGKYEASSSMKKLQLENKLKKTEF